MNGGPVVLGGVFLRAALVTGHMECIMATHVATLFCYVVFNFYVDIITANF